MSELRVEAARLAASLINSERYKDTSFGDLADEVHATLVRDGKAYSAEPPAPPAGVRGVTINYGGFTGNSGSSGIASHAATDARSTWARATAESPSSPSAEEAKNAEVFAFLRKQVEARFKEQPARALALSAVDRLERYLG